MLTIGVAEEFLLLGPDGAVLPTAPFVARQARDEDRIRPGFMAYQLVTDTAGCGSLDEVRTELSRLRRQAGDAARRAGASCTCQVRIHVKDHDQAVDVLARIRPWLPALLALTVNSPFADGRDTGWASYRYHLQQHWPTFRPPGAWDRTDRYDSMVRSLIGSDAAADESTARVPAGQPIVEVRVADACLTVEDSVVFAGIVRALVRSLITDARRNLSTTPVPAGVVDAHLNTAAHGEVRLRQDRTTLTMPPAHETVMRLVRKIGPALFANGDAGEVHRGMKRLQQHGTGADRQRRARRRQKNPSDFVRFLTGCASGG
jgi:carboxylate-amine ligase